MNITVYNTITEIRPTWLEFEKESYNYAFQHLNWIETWYEILGKKENVELTITLIEENKDTPLALLPLGIFKTKGIKILSWLGGEVSDYKCGLFHKNYFLLNGKYEFKYFWKEILKLLPKVDLIYLSHQPEYFMDMQPNPAILLGGYISQLAYSTNLNFNSTWKEYLDSKRGSGISYIERNIKQISKRGTPKIKIVTDTTEISRIFQELVIQKSRRYEETNVGNFLKKPGICKFYETILYKETPNQFSNLFYLEIDSVIIAADLTLNYENRIYSLLPSFRLEDVGKYSPGKVFSMLFLEWCFYKKIGTFDFTIGAEKHKKIWCENELKLFTYTLPLNYKGSLYLNFVSLKNKLRKLKKLYKIRNVIWNYISLSTIDKPTNTK